MARLVLAVLCLLAALLCDAQNNNTDPYNMLSLINNYDHCHVYFGGTGDPVLVSPFAVVFWTADVPGDKIEIGYTCNSGSAALSYCALAISRANAALMLDSDPAVFFADGSNGDYFIAAGESNRPTTNARCEEYPNSNCSTLLGVSQDINRGGANNIGNVTVTPQFGGIKLQITYERPMTATDSAYDAAIPTSSAGVILVSSRLLPVPNDPTYRFGWHNRWRYATDSWSFTNPPGCPNNCSNVGTCTKGCCVCPPLYGGYDCRFGPTSTVGPGTGGTDLSIYTFSGNIGKASYAGDDFRIHWRFTTVNTADDALQIALEIEDPAGPSAVSRWVAFGWGDRMDTADAWVAQGSPFNIYEDFYLGHNKKFRNGSVATDVIYGGVNNLLNTGSTYDATTGRWIVTFTRLLDTGDRFDRVIKPGWNNFIWSLGPKNEAFLSSKGHALQLKWRGRINLTTGKVELKTDLRIAHGALMFVAYAVLMVAGAIVARYFKKPLGGVWFHIHRGLMWTAVALVIAGFVIILVWVPKGSHFLRAHPRLGVAIVGLTVMQPLIGIAADLMFDANRTRTPWFPDLLHWFIGWSIIILSLVNISLGVTLISASTAIKALWYLWLALVVIGNVALFCYFFFVKKFTGLKAH